MIDGKLLGAGLVFGASTWTGFQAAAGVKKRCRSLLQLRLSLELMRCEIACRRTPVGRLTEILTDACRGEVALFYKALGQGLAQGLPVAEAADRALQRCRLNLPEDVLRSMKGLFDSFGDFPADEQLRLIELTQTKVAAALEQQSAEQKSRCRCYELLGVCTGLSLAILVA